MSVRVARPPTRQPVVWIADDSPLEAKYTERALGPRYTIEHFSDGSLVVERLAAGGQQPDVLLLDWMMPMRGDEVCRFVRSHPATADLPIIIVTASRVETSDVVEGLSIGANDYVARPFVPEELRARVDTAIRAKRMRERATLERVRLAVVGNLGRAFVDAGPRLERVGDALAMSLIGGLCDGCTITILPGAIKGMSIARHHVREDEHLLRSFAAADPCLHAFASSDEARKQLPAAYHAAIERFGMSGIAVIPFPARSPVAGVVSAMRDGHSTPFEPEDIATIETCVEYAAMAFENVLRFDAERVARTQLQTIVEQLPLGIIVAEPSGLITHLNRSAIEMLPSITGARSIAELGEHLAVRTLDDTKMSPDQYPLSRALAGETIRGFELAIMNEGCEPTFLRSSAVPLRDAAGKVAAAIVAFDDVTAEHAIAAEHQRTVEFQRYVLGIVGHDLRSPLQTIAMGCEVIRHQAAERPKILQLVDRMEAAGARAKGIIEQLLDVTRTQLGGGIPVTLADTDLHDVVDSVVAELALAHPKLDLHLALKHVRGHWDPDRLAQVVSNLVGNAIEHGAVSSPIWVETERDGDTALLRVRNVTRTQLTRDEIATIFAPFRTTTRPTRSKGGLGLGLYITTEILRAHQGAISVESDPAMTTFVVRLPIRPHAAAQLESSHAAH
jgi:signal transduction histidine kinase/CheY-like chemotaxis protein